MQSLVTVAVISENGADSASDLTGADSQTYEYIEVLPLSSSASGGLAATCKLAIETAKGDFIIFVTPGNVLLPTFVENAVALFQSYPNTAIVVCAAAHADTQGEIQGPYIQPDFDGPMAGASRTLAKFLLTSDELHSSTMMFSLAWFRQIGHIDESYETLAVREYVLRCVAASANIAYTAAPQALICRREEDEVIAERAALRLMEYCRLVIRYTGTQYHDALAGFAPAIAARMNQDLTQFKSRFPDAYEQSRSALETQVRSAMESLAQLPAAAAVSNPLISVVIPYTGRLGELSRALATLAGQDYVNWEAVIVADHAPDPTGLVAHIGLSSRARVVNTVRGHGGPSGSRNLGLSCANGDIIAYLDEDNRFEAGYLGAIARAFTEPSVMVTAGKARIAVVTADGGVLEVRGSALGASDGGVSPAVNRVPLNAIAHRRSCTAISGVFNPSFGLLEDWEFLIRLGRAFPVTPLNAHACILCFDLLLRGHELFSRHTSEQWLEYTGRLQDIYNTYPVRNDLDQTGRQEYAAKLQSIVQTGVKSPGDSMKIMAFVEALAGIS